MSTEERELAKARDFDFMIEDHGCPILAGHFEYEGSGCQGIGYVINIAFLMRLLGVFGVERLHQINGKSCWVTHTFDNITKIEPLHKKDGEAFDIAEWIEWSKRYPSPSPYEMRTGKKP